MVFIQTVFLFKFRMNIEEVGQRLRSILGNQMLKVECPQGIDAHYFRQNFWTQSFFVAFDCCTHIPIGLGGAEDKLILQCPVGTAE